MVMIPTDIGIHVRNQLPEPGLQPVRAVSGLPSDLPDFQRGQTFRAHIQEVLPQNTFKALVAGKSVTLSLLAGAKAGDTLELVVVDRTAGAIVAKLAEGGLGKGADPLVPATLSRTGQLIASLLARNGEPAAPAALSRGGPLLAQMPVSAAGLAQSLPPQLAQAIGASGLFYEAHQLQWVHGQRQLASLLAEPQGEHSRAETLAAYRGAGMLDDIAAKSALAGRQESGAARATPGSLLQALFGRESAIDASQADTAATNHKTMVSPSIPDALRPLIQQQLEAAATQRLVWHGEIWPGQEIDWNIERQAAQGGNTDKGDEIWNTNLRLTLPRLGEINARLQLVGQAVQLSLYAQDSTSATDLKKAAHALNDALTSVGLKLTGVQTSNESG